MIEMKKQDFNLTEHFKLSEFVTSATALRKGISNEPDCEAIASLEHLCRTVLEPLRAYAGRPIRINSGYRCEALNYAVGGVGNSQHIRGEAADLWLPDVETGRSWYAFIVRHCNFDQLLYEFSGSHFWLHVSACRDERRNRHMAIPNYKARRT